MESRRLREKIRVPHVDKLELQLTIRPAASMMVGERGRVGRPPRKPALSQICLHHRAARGSDDTMLIYSRSEIAAHLKASRSFTA